MFIIVLCTNRHSVCFIKLFILHNVVCIIKFVRENIVDNVAAVAGAVQHNLWILFFHIHKHSARVCVHF